MVNSKAMGILFPNSHDSVLGELTTGRAPAAIPFGGRYRLVDFPLSGLSAAGVERCSLMVNRNYVSLMDHIGSGREWDLATKNGGIKIFPPFFGGQHHIGDKISAINSIMGLLTRAVEEYIVLVDCNMVANIDYRELFSTHRQSGADITVVYAKTNIPPEMGEDNVTFEFDADKRCTEIYCNDYHTEQRNVSLSVYVIKRTLLCELVREAHIRNQKSFEKDILCPNIKKLNISGYEYDGFLEFITDRKSYYRANMALLVGDNMDKLFPSRLPVYTKIRDDAPVRYTVDSKVQNSTIADGSLIAGTVENSVLFRGVQVKKGAVVKNCVLLQDTVVEENVTMDKVITDKEVTITQDTELRGSGNYPIYIKKGERV